MNWLSKLRHRWSHASDSRIAAAGLFQHLPDAALLLDSQCCSLEANAALRRALGPTAPVRTGMPGERIFDPGSRAAFRRWWEEVHPEAELTLLPAEGRQPMLVSPVRLLLEDGTWVVLLRDVTQRHALAAQFAEADRLQALGTLAGGIAHDFNNLLAVVAGAADQALLQKGLEDDLAIRDDLQQIRQAADRGAALVRQLLAYARQQVLAPRLVPLNIAVRSMATLLQPLLGQQIRLELRLDEPGRHVRIDPSQLDRVLMNLAMNARQAMPQGGTLTLQTGRVLLLEPLRAEPEDVPPGRWTVLEVADDGQGIPKEILPRIFQPFFTSRAHQGGTGMGLATVHGIVRQSGGYLLVESAVGAGTRFRILLPRVDDAPQPAPEPATVEPHRAPPSVPPPTEQQTILLVEDQEPLRRLAERALRKAGWQVMAAEDAEDVLALLDDQQTAPSILVSDVIMPGMDGAELAARLRQRWPALPVLLVSGYAPSIVSGGFGESGVEYLAKPYRPAELVEAVQSCLRT